MRSPTPKKMAKPFQPFEFLFDGVQKLPVADALGDVSLRETLDSRRSRRLFGGSLTTQELSSLLWNSARTISTTIDGSGYACEQRPSPSAGGRHPIIPVMFRFNVRAEACFYISDVHGLALLPVAAKSIQQLAEHSQEVLDVRNATVIWFAAEWERTASKYDNAESLVWRDSGALLATMLLVAEALSLAACPLGVSGEPYLSMALTSQRMLTGVGGLAVGHRN